MSRPLAVLPKVLSVTYVGRGKLPPCRLRHMFGVRHVTVVRSTLVEGELGTATGVVQYLALRVDLSIWASGECDSVWDCLNTKSGTRETNATEMSYFTRGVSVFHSIQSVTLIGVEIGATGGMV